ncbi:MAG: osmotically inducible protein OsmC [Chloroflexus sp.]|uniref:OsmC family protein n=1 Tax=Chloroflexus sp. TaxID=1904827 RepID=UPI000F2A41CB|nr:OsmC family protein [Chloroflexus sp.]RMD74941.1 MAG: OsmC family peroxiredoxin [Chloroflexota bacterium]GIV89243.1 MAG: osmotically inducible protein OsmC [Chloroflexus sp.]
MAPIWSLREFLRRKRQALAAFRAQLAAQPPTPVTLRAAVTVAAGTGLRPVRVRDHTVLSDSGPALGGYDLGPNAPELLLAAMASCVAHSALAIAADRELALDELQVEVTGQIDYRGTLAVSAEAPVTPTGLRYTIRYRGEVSDGEMAALQADLERLCPVLLAVLQPQSLSGQVERM